MAVEVKPKPISTYEALRYLDIGENKREPGELVPEAVTWLRVESHVNCGYLKEVKVSPEAFKAAVAKYCPELADKLVEPRKGRQ